MRCILSYFPMMIDLEKKPVLVVGGGREGAQKISILKKFGCIVTLVSIEAVEEAKEKADIFLKRAFEETDIDDSYSLIVSAAGDPETDKIISRIAKEKRIPVNIVDNTKLCTFIFPAIIKEQDVVIGVSSGGKSPYLVQYLKKLITSVLPEKIGYINDRMGEFRSFAKENIRDVNERRKFLKEKLNGFINTDD